jgi:putative hydrolase of the HAD superfamily
MYSWILFDLGNVLIEYRPGALESIARLLKVDRSELRRFFFRDGFVDRLQTGELTPDGFMELFSNEFGPSLTRERLVELFGTEIDQVYREVPGLVKSLAGSYSLGVLSNTFFAHWDYFLETELATFFDLLMASHIIGYTKPDPRIFEEAVKRTGTEPGEILFVDDKEENVAAASSVGIEAFKTSSPAETIAGLRERGIDLG